MIRGLIFSTVRTDNKKCMVHRPQTVQTCLTMLWMSLSIVKAMYAWMVNISLRESSYCDPSMFPSSKLRTISRKAE